MPPLRGARQNFGINHHLTFFRYEKSSKRRLRTQYRRARIALAPGALQCIPERFSLAPMAFLQLASTTPLDTHRPCARNSPYRIRWPKTALEPGLFDELSQRGFLDQTRNMVLVGGTGKTHLAVALARAWIRNGARERFYNVVDLVNRLQDEQHAGRAGALAE